AVSDACCGHEEPGGGHPPEPERLWHVSELRAAAIAGALLAGASVSGWADAPRSVALVLQALALVIGASTFVPSTLKRLVKGSIGVCQGRSNWKKRCTANMEPGAGSAAGDIVTRISSTSVPHRS